MAKFRDKSGKVTHPNGSPIVRKSSKINPTLDMIANMQTITLAASALSQRALTKAQSTGLKNYELPILTNQIKTLNGIFIDQVRLSIEVKKAQLEHLSLTTHYEMDELENKSDEEIMELLREAQAKLEKEIK